MKKFLILAVFSAFVFACNDSADNTTVEGDTSDHAATSDRYSSSEGDVSYRGGKLMVWRNNDWVEADDDVTLDNGVVVRRNGEVERDGKVVVLDDGEIVDRSGRFWDDAGNAIEDAWDGAKEGVREAGQGIKKGAKEVGEEVKDVFKDDDNKNN